MSDEPSSLDLAMQRINTGWRVAYTDDPLNDTPWYVYHVGGLYFSEYDDPKDALTAYKAHIFDEIFPKCAS
jgi:hypothetical protein